MFFKFEVIHIQSEWGFFISKFFLVTVNGIATVKGMKRNYI